MVSVNLKKEGGLPIFVGTPSAFGSTAEVSRPFALTESVANDPGCVKTLAPIMIPLVILGGKIDEAFRFGVGSCAIDAFARMS